MSTLNYEPSRPNNIFSLKYVNSDLVSYLSFLRVYTRKVKTLVHDEGMVLFQYLDNLNSLFTQG